LKKINFLLIAGLIVSVFYTFFAMQNKFSVPVRFVFNDPVVFDFSVMVLISFLTGTVFAAMLFLIYHLFFMKSKNSEANDSESFKFKEEIEVIPKEQTLDIDEKIRKQVENILGSGKSREQVS